MKAGLTSLNAPIPSQMGAGWNLGVGSTIRNSQLSWLSYEVNGIKRNLLTDSEANTRASAINEEGQWFSKSMNVHK